LLHKFVDIATKKYDKNQTLPQFFETSLLNDIYKLPIDFMSRAYVDPFLKN